MESTACTAGPEAGTEGFGIQNGMEGGSSLAGSLLMERRWVCEQAYKHTYKQMYIHTNKQTNNGRGVVFSRLSSNGEEVSV